MGVWSLLLGLWPGLNGLIRYGRGVFLILASGFGFLASMTLFYCGYWTEMVSFSSKCWLTGGLGVSWLVLTLVGAGLSHFFGGQLAYDENGDRYLMALDAYLAARWQEAEKIAKAVLKRNKRDPEILLLLSTLYRHTGRIPEAEHYLNRLESLETAERWKWEISVERASLAEKFEEENEEEDRNQEGEEPVLIPFPGSPHDEEMPGDRTASSF